jgi:outer membrane lipoprotein-sorting protein
MLRPYWILPCLLFTAGTAAAPETSTPTTTPATWGLEQLMQQRTQVQTARASFVEVRKMPSMDSTTTTNGVLIYRAPDHLERHTSKPFPERVIIQADRLTIETDTASGQRTRREFALTDLPGPRPFFAALRATLSGNLDALRRDFVTTFDGNQDGWRLKLAPRARADQHVRDILISGRAMQVLSIDVRERSGDSAHTTMTPELSEPTPAPTENPAPATTGGS